VIFLTNTGDHQVTQINAFFSSTLRRIIDSSQFDIKQLATELGFRNDHFVRMWRDGSNMPRLDRLVDVSNAMGLPLEDLLICWLADQDYKHFARYEIIAAQLGGEDYAADLLSGQDENSTTPWWSMRRVPASAAEIALRKNVQAGTYADV
jgi:hypothetical protein